MPTVADQLRARVIRESRQRIIADVIREAQTRRTEDKEPEKPRPGSYDRDSFSEND